MQWPSKPTLVTAAILGTVLGASLGLYMRLGGPAVGLGGGAPAPKALVALGSPEGGGGWISLYRGLDGRPFARTQVPWKAFADRCGEVRPVPIQADSDPDMEIAVGLGAGGEGAVAILDDPDHECRLLGWVRVPWSEYAKGTGETRVAAGDIDGDGRDEIVVGLAKAGVAYVFDDATKGFAPLATLRVPWKAYDAACGEVRPAAGDLDGDGKAEVVLGLADGSGSGGWMAAFREGKFAKWVRFPWSGADEKDLGTWPSIGDVDGDGKGDLVVGTGPGGSSWIASIADPLGAAHATWAQVPWGEYAEVAGEARPLCVDADADGRSELAVRLAEGTSTTNVAALLEDAKGGYAFLGWRTAYSSVLAELMAEEAGRAPRTVRLQGRRFVPTAGTAVPEPAGPIGSRRHFVVQFTGGDLAKFLEALRAKGIEPLAAIGDDAVAVSAPIGATLEGIKGTEAAFLLEPADRLSRRSYETVEEKGTSYVTVEFHPDVPRAESDRVLTGLGLAPVRCEGLPDHIVVAKVDLDHLQEVARNETVAYVIPATEAMAAGKPTIWCAGMSKGPLPPAEYSLDGAPGWDGYGAGSSNLTYYFGLATADLSLATQQSEIARALRTWSNYAQVTWTQTMTANRPSSMDVHFGGDMHVNCPYNFGQYVLAHCFFPDPSNSYALAGDMHINDAYTWRVGANYDLYSVALHESGHGLGLGHSADPSSIMYPTYHGVVNDLTADDIAGIRQLYATGAGGGGGGAPPPPPPDDYGNTPATAAYMAAGGAYLSGRIGAAGDVDFFYVTCAAGYRYVVWTSALANGMDSVVTLYRPDGVTVVGENDNYGGTTASRVEFVATTAGRYYARVKHATAAGTGDYRVQASAPDDHSNLPQYATVLRIGYPPTAGTLNPAGDVDWFCFYGAAGRTVTIETSNLTPWMMDSVLDLYNQPGTVRLATNDNANPATKASRIVYTLVTTGWYTVRVRHSSWGTGSYYVGVR